MKNLLYISLLLLFGSVEIAAQIPKVAFVGVTRGTGSARGFSFVLGEDLATGTIIYFTDEEYRNGCDNFSPDASCTVPLGEPYLIYTIPVGGLTEGTVVSITENGGTETFNVIPAGSGTAVKAGSGSFSISSSDAFYAFDSDNPANPQGNVTEVYAAITFNGPWDGNLNTGEDPSPDHPAAVVFIAGGNDREYNPTLRSSAEVSKSDLTNAANWVNATAGDLSTTVFSGTVSLPVHFFNFTASPDKNNVKLTWSTSRELNNREFVIEHSSNGRDFTKVGARTGSGTTSEMQLYDFIHQQPAMGDNFYRLQQIDYDGTFEYSSIISARLIGNEASLLIHPNPFAEQVTLDLPELSNEIDINVATTVVIKNIHGQVVRQETLTSTRNYPLDLSELAAGTYFLQVYRTGQSIATQRLVKL